MIWAAGAVAAMSSITFPAISAIVSRNADPDQQGEFFQLSDGRYLRAVILKEYFWFVWEITGLSFLLVITIVSAFLTIVRLVYGCLSVGVVQGMITGIRGLCNGLGPALYGFVFYLFHVELTEPDGSEKGPKPNMANPTDEVSVYLQKTQNPEFDHFLIYVQYIHERFLFRVPLSQVLPSCLGHAQCCCLCWWPCLSQSTRGPAWGPVLTRSTATEHRVTHTAPRAAGLRARSRCWRTAVYNLSYGGQKSSLHSWTPAHMDRDTHLTTWTHSHLRQTSDLTAMKRCLCLCLCVHSTKVSTRSLAAPPFFFSFLFLVWRGYCEDSLKTLFEEWVEYFLGCSGNVCVIGWAGLFLGFYKAVTVERTIRPPPGATQNWSDLV